MLKKPFKASKGDTLDRGLNDRSASTPRQNQIDQPAVSAADISDLSSNDIDHISVDSALTLFTTTVSRVGGTLT
ncbi:MAG: hypothetical protein EA001_12510 [Oscillatoriales cyanobacterium]|nr:MAG: hypothetical protein EA001_12510 [Oscillatoriales cyanobacterium]